LLLDDPAPEIATAITHFGYVQIDPINVCGRMHDLILRHRVRNYREGDLMRHLYGAAPEKPSPAGALAFEHHLPDTNVLVAFPLEAWPHLLAAMHRRTRSTGAWSGRLTPRERELSERILEQMAAQGPLSSESIEDTRRARCVWGAATLAKSTLQKLFFHGRVLIARRDGQRRLYDLPERVLPSSVLAAKVPPAADTGRWLAMLKLRQRRLAALKRDELRLVEDRVQPVKIPECPLLYCANEDVPLLLRSADEADRDRSVPSPILLLAPLDPLIYDRRVTTALWNFDYTWEAYTPPSKRVRGYYALPVLAGLDLIGHVDPKADRVGRRLVVVSRSVRRGFALREPIAELATFLGLGARRRGLIATTPNARTLLNAPIHDDHNPELESAAGMESTR
jgi:uncharacterized protein YcaQ